MTWHVKSGGTWREITAPEHKVSGVWYPTMEGWVKTGGTYQQFFERAITVTVTNTIGIVHSVANGNTATAGVKVDKDGKIYKLLGGTFTPINESTDWAFPRYSDGSTGSTRGYSVKFEDSAILDPLHGAALDTWHALTTDRTVYLEHSTNDTQEDQIITVSISDDGGTTVLDSGTFTVQANVGLPP